ncbi:MAG: endonuclease NucS [Candidatus Hadarchaeum sp.]|nr:endonuclease NucS [Candidatus Hadarchaeum sp.]
MKTKRRQSMNERALEIIVSRCPAQVFGTGFELAAHQLSLRHGRIDLLVAGPDGMRYVVEVKKSRAKKESIEQVISYVHEFRELLGGKPAGAWVVAHDIPSSVAEYASTQGVRTLALSIDQCQKIAKECGLSESDLVGVRKTGRIINGGDTRHGLHEEVPNEVAFAAMPKAMAELLRNLSQWDNFDVRSGGCQTTICYRGAKLGGVNRKGTAHGYIASGVVISPAQEDRLDLLGFKNKTKKQTGSYHEHTWWQIDISKSRAFLEAIEEARTFVDRALGV